jgi:FMN phosphatase YigB (HAD superfamily)
MENNLILVDCDGVLLNWEYSFDVWMQERGHRKIDGYQFKYNIGKRYGIDDDLGIKCIRQFNESAAIGFLPPLRDAIQYVKKLHENHGYIFHCITSLSSDKNAKRLREMNLTKLFGDSVFEEIVCLETGADKNDALAKYRDSGCYWVEDSYQNCQVGLNLGLRPLLVSHGFNLEYHHTDIQRVANWKQIYDIIIGA